MLVDPRRQRDVGGAAVANPGRGRVRSGDISPSHCQRTNPERRGEKWKERNKEEVVQDTNREHKTWKNLSVILRIQYLTRRERKRYEYGSWFPFWQSIYNFGVYVTRPVRRLRRSILLHKAKPVGGTVTGDP